MKLFRISSFLAAGVVLVVLIAAGGRVGGQGTASPSLTILSKDGRRQLPETLVNDQELVYLDEVATAFQLTVRDEPLGAMTVSYKGRSILMTVDQPLVSIAGRLVSLPSGPVRAGRRVLVPVEFIGRALALIYDSRLDLRKPSHLLVVGDLRVPRVTVRYDGSDPSRLIVDAVPRTTSTLSQDANALTIRFDADALDVTAPPLQPQPLIQAVRFVEPATLVVDLGPRFGAFRASTQPLESSTRLTIDVMPAQTETPAAAAGTAPGAAPGAAPPLPAAPPPDLAALGPSTGGVHTIAIDPGHGGEDTGVKGAGGITEKELALTVARRVKAAIEGRLGIRVLLTREDDHNVPLASRAALANNGRADLFISLHANASFRPATSGASIVYASFDREGERATHALVGSEHLPTFGGGMREIDFVFWDLAQLRFVERSSTLAMILEEQFQGRVPLSARPVGRMPLGVLESANMPAVLIEMGYLTNPQQETQLAAPDFQNTFVQAIYDAVLKFRDGLGAGTR